jgi:hypothetical protein
MQVTDYEALQGLLPGDEVRVEDTWKVVKDVVPTGRTLGRTVHARRVDTGAPFTWEMTPSAEYRVTFTDGTDLIGLATYDKLVIRNWVYDPRRRRFDGVC